MVYKGQVILSCLHVSYYMLANPGMFTLGSQTRPSTPCPGEHSSRIHALKATTVSHILQVLQNFLDGPSLLNPVSLKLEDDQNPLEGLVRDCCAPTESI